MISIIEIFAMMGVFLGLLNLEVLFMLFLEQPRVKNWIAGKKAKWKNFISMIKGE